MTDIRKQRDALIERILQGPGTASPRDRRAAFDNTGVAEPQRGLIDKVAARPTDVSDADIAAARASGLSEDQIIELVVCAAIGQANRQYKSAAAALELALRKA